MLYSEVNGKADAWRSLNGDAEVYLTSNAAEDYPWHLVTESEEGCSYRLSVPTSISFRGFDPNSRLRLRWSFDIEDRGANGSGKFQINTKSVASMFAKLPADVRASVKKYLLKVAESVRERADEYQKAAAEQYGMAAAFESLARK
jgi:hypothetical protein